MESNEFLNDVHFQDVQEKNALQVKTFFRNVYQYMFIALGISGLTSWYLASSGLFIDWFITAEGGLSPLFYVVVFSPIALVFLIQAKVNSFSIGTLTALFVLYAALIGASIASIFFVYSMGDIAITFFVAAGAFAGMAILGYTTSTDLSKMGSLLYMAFIGIFIAAIVNMFLGSEMLSYIISIVGVFVFTGLTAWEMQKLKIIATDPSLDSETMKKMSLIGGLSLYILFVNLFLSLLRLLGGGRD
ncbi:MAG: Bax inhibitor-1/YccA family protein [Brumimicrobium sp.]|nr:Bax inhibitor-1/YccA family protein [Brumimicrobium sp.]MCO5267906.1 Bax inhibitor-1/YccA family protein [Brumimicrobium sp.]